MVFTEIEQICSPKGGTMKTTKNEIKDAEQVVEITQELPKLPTPEELAAKGWTPEEYKEWALAQTAELKAKRLLEERAEEQARKNPPFVQLYKDYMPALRRLTRANPVAGEAFLFLAEMMDQNNAVACSSRVLEEMLNVGRTTVWKVIKTLKDSGFLEVYKMGTTNVFCLNASVVWTKAANEKRYAKFAGQILLAESEQDATPRKAKGRKVKVVETVEPKPTPGLFPEEELSRLSSAIEKHEAKYTSQPPPRSSAKVKADAAKVDTETGEIPLTEDDYKAMLDQLRKPA